MFVEQMLPRARERLETIGAEAPIREAADLMMSKPHIDLVVVCGHGEMVGVLTKSDIVGQISSCGESGCAARVDTIMTRNVISCRPNELLHDVWSVMKEHKLLRIPIIDDCNHAIGVIYARDALPNLLTEAENEEAMLRDYVMSVGYQ